MKPKNNLDDCTYCMPEGQFKTQTQQTKQAEQEKYLHEEEQSEEEKLNLRGLDGKISCHHEDKTAENNQEKTYKNAMISCNGMKLTDVSPDLSSQLNPSSCGIEIYRFSCGRVKVNDKGLRCGDKTGRIIYCPICSAKRLATAKALYSEKKKTLEYLDKIKPYSNSLDAIYEISNNLRKQIHSTECACVTCNGFRNMLDHLVGVIIRYENIEENIKLVESEIKQIENEVPEVKQ